MAGTTSQDNKKGFYLIIIIVLILLNAFFAYNHYTARQENIRLTEEQTQLKSEYAELNAEFDKKQAELDAMKGQNAELDSLLAIRQTELDETRQQIEALLKDKRELDKARSLIKNLRADNQKYLAQIDSLNNQVQFLTLLSDSLSVDLQTVTEEKTQLLSEKSFLAKKVELSTLLIPESVDASGIFMKSNDREVPTNKAKKTEKLKICFEVPENRGVDAGEKTFYLRILNPQGATIAVASEGSGMFKTVEGNEMQYTTMARFNYKNEKQRTCVLWSQTQAYGAGTYSIIFFQNGHELGTGSFELK